MQKLKASALIVDDQEEMLSLCASVLAEVVSDVDTAASSSAARAAFHKKSYDLLLTDINIDDQGDGVALAQEIRNVSPGTKVIMMTAEPSLQTAIGGLKSGASEYIIKPFSIEHLASVVRAVFEKAALSSELERERAMKKELEDAYAQLKASESAKDSFLGRVNHELRTPLAIAVTSAELLGSQLQGPQKDLWHKTDRALKWLQLEIDELLLYSDLLKGDLKVQKAPADLWALLQEVSGALKFLYEDMAIKVELTRDGEPCLASADAGLLREVFRQLLVNGVKFNKKGGALQVHLRYAADHVQLTFSDTGPGVSDAALPHLFDSFFQAADYLTREVGGMGLGLATVKRVVEAHGGAVAVQKRAEGGLAFTLSLPRGGV